MEAHHHHFAAAANSGWFRLFWVPKRPTLQKHHRPRPVWISFHVREKRSFAKTVSGQTYSNIEGEKDR
jgi:hypothetical protein